MSAKRRSPQIVVINAEIPWAITRPEKTRVWVGVCEPLKLTAQSMTWADLMTDISGAMESVFQDLMETGDLEKFMAERGWTAEPLHSASKPKNVKFDIPFSARRSGLNDLTHTVPV